MRGWFRAIYPYPLHAASTIMERYPDKIWDMLDNDTKINDWIPTDITHHVRYSQILMSRPTAGTYLHANDHLQMYVTNQLIFLFRTNVFCLM